MKKSKPKKNILVVVAHPDDEILGCGGTIAKYSKKYNINLCILSDGESSRNLNKSQLEIKIKNRKIMSKKASKIIGIKKIFYGNFPDNRFDSVDLIYIIKFIENIIRISNPETVYTHYENDLNIDHRITFQAVQTAARPQLRSKIKNIFSFYIPSSTEWNFSENNHFLPNVYEDISKNFITKINALKIYRDELRESPHPRSIVNITALDTVNGEKVGFKKAEVFKLIRMLK